MRLRHLPRLGGDLAWLAALPRTAPSASSRSCPTSMPSRPSAVTGTILCASTKPLSGLQQRRRPLQRTQRTVPAYRLCKNTSHSPHLLPNSQPIYPVPYFIPPPAFPCPCVPLHSLTLPEPHVHTTHHAPACSHHQDVSSVPFSHGSRISYAE